MVLRVHCGSVTSGQVHQGHMEKQRGQVCSVEGSKLALVTRGPQATPGPVPEHALQVAFTLKGPSPFHRYFSFWLWPCPLPRTEQASSPALSGCCCTDEAAREWQPRPDQSQEGSLGTSKSVPKNVALLRSLPWQAFSHPARPHPKHVCNLRPVPESNCPRRCYPRWALGHVLAAPVLIWLPTSLPGKQ